MNFIRKKTPNIDSYSNSFEINRLITIDTISIDDNSRLTLTKKLKKVLPILPKDTITVYQDRYNKDLIFAIQHGESDTTDSFIIKTKSSSGNHNIFHDTKTIENNQQEKEESISNGHKKKKDTLYDINILIVDNEEDLLKIYEYFLKLEGYHNVQTFSDPKKVIKHFVQL